MEKANNCSSGIVRDLSGALKAQQPGWTSTGDGVHGGIGTQYALGGNMMRAVVALRFRLVRLAGILDLQFRWDLNQPFGLLQESVFPSCC